MASCSDPVLPLDFEGTAVVCPDGRAVSYAELKALSEKAAAELAPRTVRALRCRNDLETLARFVGCVNRGAVPLMLSDRADPELLARLESVYHGAPAHADLALLLTTSGTTGSPKLVRTSRSALRAGLRIHVDELGVRAGDALVLVVPLCHVYGLVVASAMLAAGGTVVLSGGSVMDPGLADAMVRHGATHFAAVPYMYEVLERLRFFDRDFPALRQLMCAGGALGPDLLRKYAARARARGWGFQNAYGQTETTGYAASLAVEAADVRPGCIGRAVGGTVLRIEAGELVCEGPQVAMGYATCAPDLLSGDEWRGVRRTGDLARIDADGTVFLEGRAARFVKVYGSRVSLDEVEDLVKGAFPGLDCAAAGDDSRLEVVVDDAGRMDEVRRFLATKLHLINSAAFGLKAVAALPRTASGKVDYRALASAPAGTAPAAAPARPEAKPLVTVVVITYNHADNIARCLDSVLGQKTSFPIRVIVIDDASTDGTADIVRRYAARDPRVVPVLHAENYYRQGRSGFLEIADRIDTPYYHLLEGDDYWCAADKLQLQVDALEAHPACTLCAHACEYRDAAGELLQVKGRQVKGGSRIYDIYTTQFCHLSSTLHRNLLPEMTPAERAFIRRDVCDFYFYLSRGKIFYFSRPMSVCRRTGTGIWSSLALAEQERQLQEWYFRIDRFLGFRFTRKFRHLYLPHEGKKIFSFSIPYFWRGRRIRVSFSKA